MPAKPKSASSVFRATLNANGTIEITRLPNRDDVENTFTFQNINEMTTALSPLHKREDIDRLLEKLAKSGSVEFRIEHTPAKKSIQSPLRAYRKGA